MKLKIAVFAIVVSTVGLIGMINIIVNKVATGSSTSTAAPVAQEASMVKPGEIRHEAMAAGSDTQPDDYEPDEDAHERAPEASLPKPKLEDNAKLSDQDERLIKAVANLSDKELAAELDTLAKRIEDEEIFERLEDGDFSPAEEIKAKQTLEKFGLLGLEKNRRKFVAIDPDLKDALYAHRDSLKEIREVLNED